jgi:hypothetical protein
MNYSIIALLVALAAIILFNYIIKYRKGIYIPPNSIGKGILRFKNFENKVIKSSILILLLLFLLTQFNFLIVDFFTNKFTNTDDNGVELKQPAYPVDNDKLKELYDNLSSSGIFSKYDEFLNLLDDENVSLEFFFNDINPSIINKERFFFLEEFINYFNAEANLTIPSIDSSTSDNSEDLKILIVKLSKQILINPKNDKLLYNRGEIKQRLRNELGAIDDFTRAIKLNSTVAEYYGSRGQVSFDYFKDVYYKKITIQYQFKNDYTNWKWKAAPQDQNVSPSMKNIDAGSLAYVGIYGQYFLNSYDCINPNQTYLNRFLLYHKSYRALPENDNIRYRYLPNTTTYYQFLRRNINWIRSQAKTRKKYFYDSQLDFKKAFELKPHSWVIASSLSNIYFYKREYSKSINILTKYLDVAKDISNHAYVYESIGDSYGASGNLIKACEFYTKSAELGNLDIYDSNKYKKCN